MQLIRLKDQQTTNGLFNNLLGCLLHFFETKIVRLELLHTFLMSLDEYHLNTDYGRLIKETYEAALEHSTNSKFLFILQGYTFTFSYSMMLAENGQDTCMELNLIITNKETLEVQTLSMFVINNLDLSETKITRSAEVIEFKPPTKFD